MNGYVIDHQEEIKDSWNWLRRFLRRKHAKVLFTGIGGVGKTVLFDHLSGAAFKQGYKPPPQSQGPERGKLAAGGKEKPVGIVVIPGQQSYPRLDAIDKHLQGRKPPDGIIHIVANGYTAIRGQESMAVLKEIQDGGLDAFRLHQLEKENDDLEELCGFIRNAHRKYRKPTWMIVAATKVDLYHKKIKAAEAQYNPGGSSKFVETLNGLQAHVGSDYFRWTAAPVCSWLENFKWEDHAVRSRLTVPQRDQMLLNFSQLLRSHASE